MSEGRSQYPSQKRYPPELRARAVQMVQDRVEESGERYGVIARVARPAGGGSGVAAELGSPSDRCC